MNLATNAEPAPPVTSGAEPLLALWRDWKAYREDAEAVASVECPSDVGLHSTRERIAAEYQTIMGRAIDAEDEIVATPATTSTGTLIKLLLLDHLLTESGAMEETEARLLSSALHDVARLGNIDLRAL